MKCNYDCFNCQYPDCMQSEEENVKEKRMSSINSEVGKKNKEIFEQLVKDAGYKNIRQFCKDVGVDPSNLYTNLDGSWKMSMKRMFKVANTLNVPILQIIAIFYPDELAENQSLF